MSMISDYRKLVDMLNPSNPATIHLLESRLSFPLGDSMEVRFTQYVDNRFGIKYHVAPKVSLSLSVLGISFELVCRCVEDEILVRPEGPWDDLVNTYIALLRDSLNESQDDLSDVTRALNRADEGINEILSRG